MPLEVGQHRGAVLHIMPQEPGSGAKMGISDSDVWIKEALGSLPQYVKVINAITDPLPATIEEDAIVISGSVHSVYDGDPWIARLEDLVRRVPDGKKILGICFGHQLIGQAFGGVVTRGKLGREIGVASITLTPQGRQDKLFDGLPSRFSLATSHADVIEQMPLQATLYAWNGKYANQSFAIGDNIRTLQPHPEITCSIISAIVRARENILVREGVMQPDELAQTLQRIESQKDQIQTNGKKIFENWMRYHVYGSEE